MSPSETGPGEHRTSLEPADLPDDGTGPDTPDLAPAGPRVTVRSRRRLAGGAAVGIALLGLVACGTSQGGAASTSGTSGTASGAAAPGGTANEALMTCLQENGVPAPPSGGGEGGAPASGAAPADGSTPPSGAPDAGGQAAGGGQDAGGQAAGGQAGTGQAPPGVDATVWAKAQEACASVAATAPTSTG
ncbi:hypothetical protein EV383_1380 [Pseudonocardia sediminis]|uniref:PT repeat-containing protein n=1 Tax=Pseudonocardia sediminis TaxID=1397368 RepID=A0A4Q7US76_PSEST|nr:hypothetical protein [Pseudonocardia sediminis]RZT84535.1 hypothetical protein EV383_1380 [Pseudonocardia sediminis]